MYPEAVGEWQTAMRMFGNPALAATGGEAFRTSGFQAFLQTWLDSDIKSPSADQLAYGIAQRYAMLGKKNEAVSWLEKAYAARSGGMAKLNCDPAFDSVRSDPGFQAVLKRMNFPQ
jgi:hypothetical protein